MSYTFTSNIIKEGKLFVANCLELGVVSQGKTVEEAQANLYEAVLLYLEGENLKKIKQTAFSFMSRFEVTV